MVSCVTSEQPCRSDLAVPTLYPHQPSSQHSEHLRSIKTQQVAEGVERECCAVKNESNNRKRSVDFPRVRRDQSDASSETLRGEERSP